MFKREESTKKSINRPSNDSKTQGDKMIIVKNPLDKYLLGSILFLVVFGLVLLFSASLVTAHSSTGDTYYYVKGQFIPLLLGLIFLFVLSKIDYHFFRKYSFIFLVFAFVSLILVFIPGLSAEHGTSRSWIMVFGQSLQPAEFMKLFLILYLSAWVESRKDDLKIFSTGFLPFLTVISAIGILLVKQPDLGTLILVFVIALSIYFVAEGNMKQIIILSLILLMGVFYLFIQAEKPEYSGLVKDYQLNRIRCLQNPEFNRDTCYQVNQSLIAVGSGGVFGLGLGNSRQKFNYLPEVWSDSIFPVIAEELGFVGAVLLILIYLFIFIKGMAIARRAPDMYGRSLAVGISVWIFFQAFLNIAGMINLVPMTGVPLPFISAGGSSLLVLLASCGVLLNISRQRVSEYNKNIKRIN